jgi:hypothetical protein
MLVGIDEGVRKEETLLTNMNPCISVVDSSFEILKRSMLDEFQHLLLLDNSMASCLLF